MASGAMRVGSIPVWCNLGIDLPMVRESNSKAEPRERFEKSPVDSSSRSRRERRQCRRSDSRLVQIKVDFLDNQGIDIFFFFTESEVLEYGTK